MMSRWSIVRGSENRGVQSSTRRIESGSLCSYASQLGFYFVLSTIFTLVRKLFLFAARADLP